MKAYELSLRIELTDDDQVRYTIIQEIDDKDAEILEDAEVASHAAAVQAYVEFINERWF